MDAVCLLSSKAALNDVIGNDTDSSVAVMEPQVRILKDQWKLLLLVIINVIRSCYVFPYDISIRFFGRPVVFLMYHMKAVII